MSKIDRRAYSIIPPSPTSDLVRSILGVVEEALMFKDIVALSTYIVFDEKTERGFALLKDAIRLVNEIAKEFKIELPEPAGSARDWLEKCINEAKNEGQLFKTLAKSAICMYFVARAREVVRMPEAEELAVEELE